MAIGTGFVDQQAVSTATNQWQLRSATVTLPAGTSQIPIATTKLFILTPCKIYLNVFKERTAKT